MRIRGEVASTRSLGLHDHVCWVYEDSGDVHMRVVDFLYDGLAQGQRVCYFTYRDNDELLHILRDLDDVADAVGRGAAEVRSLAGGAPGEAGHEPAAAARTYTRAAQDALAAGYTGLRVAAESTALVRLRGQLGPHALHEHWVDRCTVRDPVSALCVYDRNELGDELAAHVACVHPASNAEVPPFRLHVCDDAAMALSGELDLSSTGTLTWVLEQLEQVEACPESGAVVIDCTDLTFIDHRSLFQLSEFAERLHATVVLRTDHSAPRRLVELLGLQSIRVEQA